MKKFLLSAAAVTAGFVGTSQFLDDFESYSAGSYLGAVSPDWTTWDGVPSTTDDVQITNTDAHSGNNSIYFSTTLQGGGPQDVVLPFGGAYSTGDFQFEMWMRVESNKGAYYNFQSEVTTGVTWALECQFRNDGSFAVVSDGATVISGTYPTNVWFKVAWDIDLDLNNWELLFDGTSKGSFSNNNNQIASLDIFPVNDAPGNQSAGYYCDDVAYTYTPTTLPTLNAATVTVKPNVKLVGQTGHPTVTIRNLGLTTITSFHIEVTYNGNTISEHVTSVNILSLATHEVQFTGTLTAVTGSNNVVATVSQVNGGGVDGNPLDDSKSVPLTPITPAPGKMVVAEEATGTWCGWCPRGTVAMYGMQETYAQFWAGIAVHNGDPMVHTDYDAGMGALISGYPSALVDRVTDIDPTGIESDFLARIQIAPTALVDETATFDPGNNKVNVHADVTFQSGTSGSWKIALVATEQGVTGTGTQWAQSNYYSFQSNNLPLVGAGKDWQAETNPVPANEMVYDHVARLITPSFGGNAGFPATINASDNFDFDFEVSLDPSWEKDNMEFIVLLFNPSGEVDNADKVLGENVHPVGIETAEASLFTMHPNPASDVVLVNLSTESKPEVMITDMLGRIVYDLHPRTSGSVVEVPVDYLSNGVYLVSVRVGNTISSQRLVIE
jgi:hypothetical protein